MIEKERARKKKDEKERSERNSIFLVLQCFASWLSVANAK